MAKVLDYNLEENEFAIIFTFELIPLGKVLKTLIHQAILSKAGFGIG